jgi:Icc-related predicted phosphoesterase
VLLAVFLAVFLAVSTCCAATSRRAVPELTYDVVARRFERGSEAVLAAIDEYEPPLVLFGHVHQPLTRRMRIGRTECVNVGHFRATGAPYVLEW